MPSWCRSVTGTSSPASRPPSTTSTQRVSSRTVPVSTLSSPRAVRRCTTAGPTRGNLDSVDTPDTIVGPLEVGDPVAGDLAVDAVDRTGGRAVVVDDDAILEAGADAASETGVEVGATGGVAVAGTRELAEDGAFDADDTVALLNSVAGSKEADLLRSYLMSQGM